MKTLNYIVNRMTRLEQCFEEKRKLKNPPRKELSEIDKEYKLLKKTRNYLECNPREQFVKNMLGDTEYKLAVYTDRIKNEVNNYRGTYEQREVYKKELTNFYDLKGLKERITMLKFVLDERE